MGGAHSACEGQNVRCLHFVRGGTKSKRKEGLTEGAGRGVSMEGRASKPEVEMSFFDCVVTVINGLLQTKTKSVAGDDRWYIRLQQWQVLDRLREQMGLGMMTCMSFDREDYRQIIPRIKEAYEEAGWAEVITHEDKSNVRNSGFTLTFFASAAPSKTVPVAPEDLG